MKNIEIIGVRPEYVKSVWPSVSQWADEALEKGGSCGLHLPEDVLQMLYDERMQLWIILADNKLIAACTTEIYDFPQGRSLTVVTCGGTGLELWAYKLNEVLESFALANGCRQITCHGRKGWKKVLNALGWHEVSVTYAKEL